MRYLEMTLGLMGDRQFCLAAARPAWRVGLALLLLATAAALSPAAADEPNQAGLVIQYGEGQTETQCIPFEGAEIAGNDFLARSGLDLVIDASSGLGITVCQIEGQGCAFPAEHCFCQCMGGEDCHYWNYFYRDPGDNAWTYSPLGALLHEVQPGSVEAWVWGNGQTPPGAELTFEAICSPAGPTQPLPTPPPVASSPTPTARATAAAATTAAAAMPSPSVPPAAAPTVSTATTVPPSPTGPAPTSPTPASPGAPADAASYGIFGLLMLGLLLIGIVVWLRHR
jgi:hypothetical protein